MELGDSLRVRQQLEGVFQRFELVGADEHGGAAPVAGHGDAVVGVLDPVDHLGELGLHLGERQRVGHDPNSSHIFPKGEHVGGTTKPPHALGTFRPAAGAPNRTWVVLGRPDALPIGVVLVLSFVLMPVFRSILVPLEAVVMNLVSIGAAYGFLGAILQWGWTMT